MAKIEHKIIGRPDQIQFEFKFVSDSQEKRTLAWGEGLVRVFDEDYWVMQEGGDVSAFISWTWVDLLEFLGQAWTYLLLEETYPVDVNPLHPGRLRQALSARWENLWEDATNEEDELIYKFESRHAMARGMKGIHLPSILFLRQGKEMWLCTENNGKLLPLEDIVIILEEVGEYISESVRLSDNNRARRTYDNWNNRKEKQKHNFFQVRSGIPIETLIQLQGDQTSESYWEIGYADQYEDSEMLAAARMSANVIGVEEQRTILAKIKELPKFSTEILDELTEQSKSAVHTDEQRPYEAGYALARWLRHELHIDPTITVNPKEILKKWKVNIETIKLDQCRIDAIACWGKYHGPSILLNKGKGGRPIHTHGERTTLAHEICHLLIDRD